MYVSGLALTLHEELQTTKKYILFGFYSNSGDNCLFSVTEALLNSLIQLASVKRLAHRKWQRKGQGITDPGHQIPVMQQGAFVSTKTLLSGEN